MFWLMNNILNPLMLLILRGPFHRLLSGSLLALTVYGKKSGKPYPLVVNYTQIGQQITIIPAMAQQKTWWRNLRGGGMVDLTLKGRHYHASATLIEGEHDQQAAFAALQAQVSQFPKLAGIYGIKMDAQNQPTPQSLSNAAASTVLVSINLH